MWLVEVVNANKQLSLSKNSVLSTGFQLVKPNCHFSELQIRKVMVPMVTRAKSTILFLGSVNVPIFAISTKLYFVKIS